MAASDINDGVDMVRRHGILSPGPCARLAHLLDLEAPTDVVPVGWHILYLLNNPTTAELGEDGHVARGVPGAGALGRMFAGGRITTHRPLVFGQSAQRQIRTLPPVHKQGRTGALTFVTVEHSIIQGGQVAVTEHQNLVYRDLSSTGSRGELTAPPVRSIAEDEPRCELDVDEVMLFRFSALTYNAHRIHFDRDWCRRSGYPDLVVHGPLMALLGSELARRQGIDLIGREYIYRVEASAFGAQRITAVPAVEGLGSGVEVLAADGTRTVTGHFSAP
ncbi:Uncharacterized conserved protein [Dermatophilus congolensis]|uniref:Uncharacterized conserved protein n=1 Tax=Dermatophilus congolensis TaxID=1863 RepID=A0AA46BME9_9MICO|nr:mesaconyl-C4 CoA hydratase [Dermatophilus congolensis]STD07217.1 Uncharacterized conserved protein [Dermatophilus congolensis]